MDMEQSKTNFDLTKRVFCIGYNDPHSENDVVVEIDASKLTNVDMTYIQQLSQIIQSSGEVGTFRLNGLTITIYDMNSYEKDLIVCK
jgi:hypothetical protein